MAPYIFSRNSEGVHIINLGKTLKKICLAARIIAAVKNPKNVCVVGSNEYATRAIYKFCQHTGASCVASRWVPGTLTNQITKQYIEPRVIDMAVDIQYPFRNLLWFINKYGRGNKFVPGVICLRPHFDLVKCKPVSN